ncbi:hypothetical protein POF51_26370 [Brevibacillus sp. AG]|uniref:hypothetical protein n=1 Tax=Brevibacillus sp. AG TaxID=3020891 RepID=UPI00232D7F34|nr:hypothetical protein [Brevibacillus sp. AG]MDC0764249.1 hypothetical protein [Brevibacillus sp. AG]
MFEESNVTDPVTMKYLIKPAIGTKTAYGSRFTTVLDYSILNDADLDLFSNKTAQRTVKLKRAEKIAKNYFNILTKESDEDHELPFQSSFVFNLNLKENGLSEENLLKDGFLHIPCIKQIFSIRDGGHRKVASILLIRMLNEKIDNIKSNSKRAYYELIKRKFLELSFTADIYVDLDDTYSKRCLLDLGKSEPVSPGREFYFVNDAYAEAIEYLSDQNNINIVIDLDNSKYSKYNGLSVPLNYVSDMIKIIGDALEGQGKMTPEQINKYLIEFMTDVLLSLKIDSFNFKNNNRTEQLTYLVDCKVNLFNSMKRLLNKAVREARANAIKKVVGVDILFSKLASKPKKEVLDVLSETDLISRFNEIRNTITTASFKTEALNQNEIEAAL